MNEGDVVVGALPSGLVIVGVYVPEDLVLKDALCARGVQGAYGLSGPLEPLAAGAVPMVDMNDLTMCKVATRETRQSYLDYFSPILKPKKRNLSVARPRNEEGKA